ncbi:MAG TPA: hypothetical protein DHV62_04970 [Elusimicrobia bacterium]|jgi:hypothetical protein|nr:hypothetical protein [Elusimicrobiota bacterium]
MLKEKKINKLVIFLFLLTVLTSAQFIYAEGLAEQEVIDLLDISLRNLTQELKTLNPEIRKVLFYSLKGDRRNISQPLLRQLQGKIESTFVTAGLKLVYAPGFKPIQIGVSEERVSLVSGFKDIDEMRETAAKLKLDGFMEGELFLAERRLHLNIRIFDAETMAIVWSKDFSNILPTPPPKPRTTGIDIGFGGAGLSLSRTVDSQDLSVPSFVYYYTADLRITQTSELIKNSRYIFGGQIFYLSEGVESKKISLVSGKLVGGGFALRGGIYLSLIKAPTKSKNRSWLATELSLGKIFSPGVSQTAFFLGVECDITEDMSSAFRVAYVIPKEITVETSKKVSAGGIYYEISLLRFNFNP